MVAAPAATGHPPGTTPTPPRWTGSPGPRSSARAPAGGPGSRGAAWRRVCRSAAGTRRLPPDAGCPSHRWPSRGSRGLPPTCRGGGTAGRGSLGGEAASPQGPPYGTREGGRRREPCRRRCGELQRTSTQSTLGGAVSGLLSAENPRTQCAPPHSRLRHCLPSASPPAEGRHIPPAAPNTGAAPTRALRSRGCLSPRPTLTDAALDKGRRGASLMQGTPDSPPCVMKAHETAGSPTASLLLGGLHSRTVGSFPPPTSSGPSFSREQPGARSEPEGSLPVAEPDSSSG